MIELDKKTERAIAVSVIRKGGDRKLAVEHLEELSFLAQTAGAEVVEMLYQELPSPNRATMIGKGKVQEVLEMATDEKVDIVVFDDDLSPMQLRNLENELGLKVMDRSGIILDIFASRAQTKAAKTQVELAQLQYMLPRLTRMWTHLSRQQGGGIGTRGPGETQIETDRRMIRARIENLKSTIKKIEKQSEQKRKNHIGMPRFGLVGYTNAGKSTLMKAITKEKVYIEDKLFATLDTTVRKFELPLGQEALLSDTVGFIRKLPSHLIASFHSTLAEAREADYLLHVVDVTHPYFRDHIKVVEETLEKLNVDIESTLLVFNKIDQLEDTDELELIKEEFPESIFISAFNGTNIEKLLALLQKKYDEMSNDYEFMLPYQYSDKLNNLYALGEIIERKDTDDGFQLVVRVQDEKKGIFENQFQEFISK